MSLGACLTVRRLRPSIATASVRRRSRALCTCDFDVPSAMPRTSPTSRCSSPSMSCSTNAARQPIGQLRERPLEIHLRHRPLRQPAAARVRQPRLVVQRDRSAGWPVRRGCAGSRGTGSSPAGTATCRAPTRRGSCRASGAPTRKISCSRSSASAGLPTIRNATLNSRPGVRAVQLLERAQLALAASFDQRQVALARRGRPGPVTLDGAMPESRCLTVRPALRRLDVPLASALSLERA